MTNTETVKTKDNTTDSPSKGVIAIRAAATAFLLLVFFPTLLISFSGTLLTHDTVWLERALVVFKYSIIGFVAVLVLCCLIGGVAQLYKAFSALRSKD